MTVDYKSTVFLPKTDFPMRAGLPKREPEILAHWQKIGLQDKLRETAKGREPFILHDGPPYANGHLHIGHALNKILKDVINRAQQMMGRDANYVPGWDCHGLPIEWKIEEQYRAKGQNKDDVPILEFRRECREFAAHWVDIQTEEFKRLGVEGDWRAPYTTMSFNAEAQIAEEIGKFLMTGGLFQGARPVMWSVVEKTALAEAEIEYHDHTSVTIMVRFAVTQSPLAALENSSVIIWTTTPWTMPANRAVAYGAEMDYAVYSVDAVADGSSAQVGERIVISPLLLEQVRQEAGIDAVTEICQLKGGDLAGTITRHPLAGQGYDFDVPLLEADFVTTDQGTGFVHIAPGHGADDFELGRANGLEAPQTVGDDGYYYDHVPLMTGLHVLKDNAKIADIIAAAGGLLARGSLLHSYPHSWRSKAPLIFRNTPQWFISMETNQLRETALKAINDTRFVPEAGRNRLYSMIEARPDWCISRQRAWGVPIAIFVNKKTREPLRDQAVVDRIVAAFKAEGSDAWYASAPSRFLGDGYDADDYEQVTDIVDVWFDSGSTHSFVLEGRNDLQWPASLYLEGSDQHRGWFHSSLLESCGTRGRAPYDAVLTHGFVMDEQGRKMSKSLGNTTTPQQVIDQSGADILRLWVVGSDYSEDLRIGKEILKHHADLYRRLRNTLRFLLGSLQGFEDNERVAPSEMPELERWTLNRLWEIDKVVRANSDSFDFHDMFTQIHNFCSVDLSAFYFDIRKDVLYCDGVHSPRRRATRTVLNHAFNCLTAWLAPILCFTAEEAWQQRHGADADSVHLRVFPEIPDNWQAPEIANRWEKLRDVRRVVTGALERARAEKHIGSSLQAHPTVYLPAATKALFDGLAAEDIFITSDVTFSTEAAPEGAFQLPDVADIAVVNGLADGEKCARCWKILPEVGAHENAICGRCDDAVQQLSPAAVS